MCDMRLKLVVSTPPRLARRCRVRRMRMGRSHYSSMLEARSPRVTMELQGGPSFRMDCSNLSRTRPYRREQAGVGKETHRHHRAHAKDIHYQLQYLLCPRFQHIISRLASVRLSSAPRLRTAIRARRSGRSPRQPPHLFFPSNDPRLLVAAQSAGEVYRVPQAIANHVGNMTR
jgi:hypothetical protein